MFNLVQVKFKNNKKDIQVSVKIVEKLIKKLLYLTRKNIN